MILIDHLQFRRATRCSEYDAERLLPFFQKAMSLYRISKSKMRIAAFLSQCGHESMNLSRLSENLNYSKDRLLAVWPGRFNEYSAAVYQRDPEAIANNVYSRRMGNGDENSGDGWKFRGRGFIQLTGRNNYTDCGKALGLDLLNDPDLLQQPEQAAMAAAWYWDSRRLNTLADMGDTKGITRTINGGLNGLEDRRQRYADAMKGLRVAKE